MSERDKLYVFYILSKKHSNQMNVGIEQRATRLYLYVGIGKSVQSNPFLYLSKFKS